MNREVLIIQPDEDISSQMSSFFRDWGDTVHASKSIKSAGEQLKITLPDILIIDITLLGSKWDAAIPKLKERFQRTNVIFTYSAKTSLPQAHSDSLVKWQVLTLPISEERIEKALAGKLTKYDILEPLQKKARLAYPIRFQISWPYLALALFFSLAATYITTRIVFDSAEERFANQLLEAGNLSSEWMVIEEEHLLETLRLVINTTGLPVEVNNAQTDNLHRMIYPLAVNAQVENIEILDLEGSTIYSLHHIPGSTMEDYQSTTGGSFFKDHEITSTILQNGSDEFGDKYAASVSSPWGNIFYVAGPISIQDRLVGVALVGKSLPSLVKEMRETTLAQTTIYDLDGQVLSTTFINSIDLPAGQSEIILRDQDISSNFVNKNIADIPYTEILGPWEARNDIDLGILGAALPQNYLVHTSWITRTQIFVALGAFITLVLLLGYRLANRISKPLERLAKASEEVSKGNFLVTLEEPGSKEVSVLNNSFNDMLKSLESSRKDLVTAYDNSLEGWSRALSLRDHHTDEHSKRVVELTLILAAEIGFSEAEIEDIRRGALLHDIGKVGIPDEILRKTDSLTTDEFTLMKQHPLYAVEMLKPVSFLQNALDIPLYHHEKWDGTGYPYGLEGEKIPLQARVFAVADVYDALISNRPYRKAWSKQQAVQYLLEEKGKHFDPQVVDLFVKVIVKGGHI
jgi:putative nucleotidyltransferase with HDIG domain